MSSSESSSSATDGVAVRIEKSADGKVWTVILNRPHARNAVDRPTAHALVSAFRAFDDDDVACVAVLYGDGGVFCAGADLTALGKGDSERINEIAPVGEADGPMGPTRMKLSKPVIAAVSGFAVAGGLEVACWCDLRVVEEDAIMGVFCRRWGVPLIDGGTVRLPRLIGESRALDLILTGRPVDATEAALIGLANRVVRTGSARAEAEKLAAQLAVFPQLCMRQDRLSVMEQYGMASMESALQNEYERGLESLAEAASGAARFAAGEGRHGSFSAFSGGGGVAGDGGGAGSAPPDIEAVMFDLGGVIVGSPFIAIRQYETELNLPKNAINMVIAKAGGEGAFQRLERGEIDVEGFITPFERECKQAGLDGVDPFHFIRLLSEAIKPRPLMVDALDTLREAGLKTAILTNNFRIAGATAMLEDVRSKVDTVVESAVEGMRKPDPAIYKLACERLGTHPSRIAYLDDIGANLKPARQMGMHTIKVAINDHTGSGALAELQKLIPRVALRIARARM